MCYTDTNVCLSCLGAQVKCLWTDILKTKELGLIFAWQCTDNPYWHYYWRYMVLSMKLKWFCFLHIIIKQCAWNQLVLFEKERDVHSLYCVVTIFDNIAEDKEKFVFKKNKFLLNVRLRSVHSIVQLWFCFHCDLVKEDITGNSWCVVPFKQSERSRVRIPGSDFVLKWIPWGRGGAIRVNMTF